MRRPSIYSFVLCILAFTSFTPAVASAQGSQIVGKWSEVNGQDKIVFTGDGKFTGVMTYAGNSSRRGLFGKYFIDEDKISVNLKGFVSPGVPEPPMTLKFKFSGGYLVVTYLDGGMVKYDGSMARFERSK